MEFKANIVILKTIDNFKNTIERGEFLQLVEHYFEIEDDKYYLNNQMHLLDNNNEPTIIGEELINIINKSFEELIKQYKPIQPYIHNLILHNNSINVVEHSSCIISPIIPENNNENSTKHMYKVTRATNYKNVIGFHSESIFILTDEDVEKDYMWVDEYFESLFQILIKNIPST